MKKLCPYKCEGIELQALVNALKGGALMDVNQVVRTWMLRGMLGLGLVFLVGTLAAFFVESLRPLLPAGFASALVLLIGSAAMRRPRSIVEVQDTVVVERRELATMNRDVGATRWASVRRPKAGVKGLKQKQVEAELPGIRLIRCVGRGTQGVVWFGEIESTNEPVAIKLFDMMDKEAARSLLREVTLCSRVNHPNILNIILSDWANRYFVLVMEWVEGESLHPDLFPDLEGKLECIRQLARGIQAIANAEIVHRDIKPSNIMVRRQRGEPVIVDFGVAFDVRTRNLGQHNVSGTPFFMPPESFEDEVTPTPGVDAYALGVLILYLFGCLDFASDREIDRLVQEKRNGSFDSRLAGLAESLPSAPLRDLVGGLMDPDPKQRMQAVERTESLIDEALVA